MTRATKAAGLPTALVAAAVPAGKRKRSNPVAGGGRAVASRASALTARGAGLAGRSKSSRRRRRAMKMARQLGTVVSAVSFAADVLSQMNSISKPGESGVTER